MVYYKLTKKGLTMKGDSIGDQVTLEITIAVVNKTVKAVYEVIRTAYSQITDDKKTIFRKIETISGDAPDIVIDFDKKDSGQFDVPAGFVIGIWNDHEAHLPVQKIERVGIKISF